MIESHFIRTIAGYFGIPLLMFVSFVLLLFWLCKLYQNSVVTNVPNHVAHQEGQRPPIPPRGFQLRPLINLILLLFLCQILHGPLPPFPADASDEETCDARAARKAFARIRQTLQGCIHSEEQIDPEIYQNRLIIKTAFCSGFCQVKEECLQNEGLNASTPYIWYAAGAGFLVILAVLGIILRKNARPSRGVNGDAIQRG